MLSVGLEPTIPVFEREKTVYDLGSAAARGDLISPPKKDKIKV
jgi:hypothetical protein